MLTLSEEEITHRLAAINPADHTEAVLEFPGMKDFVHGSARHAAVLIPLLCQDDRWHVLYTRRNAALPEHSGQVSFPGGQSEPDDRSPEETALREAHEEIGLDPEDVRVIGRLPTYLTITNYLVTPIVGIIPWPYHFEPKAEEVARIFTIPLEWLAVPTNHEARLRKLPSPHASARVIYFQRYDGELLWGASARFTLSLLEALQLIK